MGVTKVLQVMAGMDCGGVETFAMNILRSSDAKKIKFDFAQAKDSPSFYDKEIKTFGSNIYYCGKPSKNPFKYIFNLAKALRRGGPYNAVHCQVLFFSAVPLAVAYFLGVPVRICHSHATNRFRKRTLLRKIYEAVTRPLILIFATDLYACSQEAGIALYGKKARFIVVPNSINCEAFKFNAQTRQTLRESLGLKDNFVIGHVGRFFKVKNHTFLLDVFAEIIKQDAAAKLMLIGTGELEQDIKNKAKRLNIEQNILFMGLRNDAANLMQAMDVFAMPSLYEGLPLSAIEAQAAGLPCFFTDTLTREMNVFNCSYLPLSAREWADKILSSKNNPQAREKGAQAVTKAGFDMKDTATKLLKIYGRAK